MRRLNVLSRSKKSFLKSRISDCDYTEPYFEEVKKYMMGSHGGGDVWIENIDRTLKSFVSFAQSFFDKKTTTLESTKSVTYSVLAILANVSAKRKL